MRIFCSICKDTFIPYSEVHVTKCGHLYHESCISTWIKQHKTCPQCRSKTSATFRVFFDVEKDSGTDPSTLEHELEVLSDKLRETERQRKNVQENYSNLLGIVDSMKECALSLTKKNDVLKTSIKALKGQVTKLTKQNESVAALENEVDMWKSKVAILERTEAMVKGSAEETNKMIAATPVTELAVKQLCIYVGVLKNQLVTLEEKNLRLTKENKEATKALAIKTRKDSFESEEIKSLRENNRKLETELQTFKRLYESIKIKNQIEKENNIKLQPFRLETNAKRSLFEMDLDFDDSENTGVECITPEREDKTINHWEKLVCAGPSRNVGLSFQKSKFFSKNISGKASDCNVLSSFYAFDGMGGRKKLRLGCPTPAEEFEKIKRKKDKKSSASTFQHTKIVDFCQID